MYYSRTRGAQPIVRLSYYCAGSPGMDDPNVSSFLELPSPPSRAAIYILEIFFPTQSVSPFLAFLYIQASFLPNVYCH